MDTKKALEIAGKHIASLGGHVFDLLTVSKPVSQQAALNLAKVVSKLSPMLGNLLEFNTVEFLNDQEDFNGYGRWQRQDPGFPDTIFVGEIAPTPGFEIKAWFPLATEITARFRDSQNHFGKENINVAMLAWLPEHLIYGKPYILDVCVASALSVARARDDHYHNPPDYLVIEPEDTAARTRNLQQTNTAGFKFQGTEAEFRAAQSVVAGWGANGARYQPTAEYQHRLRQLMGQFKYRGDTNYAKMDRIVHGGIEEFKTKVLGTQVHGMTILKWSRLLASGDDVHIAHMLQSKLDIKEADTAELLE